MHMQRLEIIKEIYLFPMKNSKEIHRKSHNPKHVLHPEAYFIEIAL